MTFKVLYGDFLTGAINENQELPVVGSSSSFTRDINAQDKLTLTVSKHKLGVPDWSSILSEASTLIAWVDDSKAWNDPDAVLCGGMLNKIAGKVGSSLTLQVMGLREYLAALICNPKLSGTYSNPNSGVVFGGSTWRGIYVAVMQFIQTIPKTPQIFGNISGIGEAVADGGTFTRPVLYGDGVIFADLLDSLRDNESDRGTEYLFPLRWASAAKDAMVFDTIIGSDTNPQINYEQTITIPLAKVSDFKSIEFSLSISTEQMANRVIAQSKQGNFDTSDGADLTSFSVDNGKPLLDLWYNVGQELPSVDSLATYANARLDDVKEPKGTATYSVIGEPGEWFRNIGKKIQFIGEAGTEAEGYSRTLRLTGVNGSIESKSLQLDLMLPAARYPKLPSDSSKKKMDWNDPSELPIGATGPGGVGLPSNSGVGKYVPPAGIIRDPVAPPPKSPNYEPNLWSTIYTSLAILEWDTVNRGGKLFTWGDDNSSGQLGYGNTNASLRPQQEALLGTDWIACQAGQGASIGVRKAGGSKTQGTLWLWGTYKSAPKTTVPAQVGTGTDWVAVCYASTTAFGDSTGWGFLALKADGTLWKVYDYNTVQQMTGLPLYTSIQTKIRESSGIYGVSKNGKVIGSGTEENDITNVKSYARTYDFNSTTRELVVKTDKTLWQRDNGYGAWTQVGTATNWEFCSGGYYCVGANNSAGECWMLGQPTNGQAFGALTKIDGLSGAERCYFGNSSGGGGSSFILDSQGLWVIGNNSFGVLGTGDTSSRSAWTKQ